MKKIKLYSLVIAAAAMSLVSCSKKEVANPDEEIFHVVRLETETSEAKTTMEIDGTTVNFAWEATDYDDKLQRFSVWENGTQAFRVVPQFDGAKLSLEAHFVGDPISDPQYVGFLNGKVPALQVPRTNQYDADADVLIAESRTEDEQLLFYFKRVVAIGRLTLKGIDEGEKLQSVTFELVEGSDQFLTASLARDNDGEDGWAWTNPGKKITLNCNHTIEGEASPALYFTCAPVTEGMFTVKAVTDKNTYTKTFGKPISLTRGNVKGMTVAMEKDEKATFDYELTVSNAPSGYNSSASNIYNQNGVVFKAANIMKNGNGQPTGYNASQFIQMKSSQCSLYNDTELSLLTVKVIYQGGAFALQTKTKSSDSWSSAVTGTAGNQVISGLKTTSGASTIADTDAKANLKTLTYNLSGKKYFRIQPSAVTHVYKIIVTVGESTPTGIKLATPANLAINADKQVVWDRVENAGSYNVYIGGGDAINVTDHYYDASETADGYYNVAVEAVPANSEMFVTSDKANLANAKFGTPTLATPAPEVEKTDNTITLTWNTDSHATEGYTYTLYKGEDVVESPSANYSVAEGVATLVYSNLSPKTAYSVKVHANLVEQPLRYEASEVYTTDPITTLSSINYAALQNGTYSENPAYAAVGEDVTFAATPANGYEFESVSVTGVEAGDIERADDVFSFTMPDLAEVTVSVTFKQSGFTLTVADDIENGTVTIDEPKDRYTVTDVIGLTVTPDEHYEVVPNSVVARKDGETDIHATHLEGTAYQLTGLHFDAQIVAGFKKIDYAIKTTKPEHGTLAADANAHYGDKVVVMVEGDAGYEFASIIVTGDKSSDPVSTEYSESDEGYVFTMPGEPVTIAATFSAIDYTVTGVTISDTCHGSVTADKTSGVHIGETVTLTVTPEYDWYQLKAGTLKVNNGDVTLTQVGTTNQYTFTMPAADVTVTAQFEKKSYNISDQSGSNGSLSFRKNSTNVSTAQYGDEVEIVVTPASADYELTPSTLRAYKYGGGESLTITDSRFTMKNFSVSVTADFRKKTFTFTKDGSSNLSFDIQNTDGTSITSVGSISGQTVKLVASGVNDGKQAKWTVTGTSGQISTTAVAGTDNQATFTMPVSDVTIKCEEGAAETVVTFSNLGYTSWGKSAAFSSNTYDELSQKNGNVTFDYIRGSGSTYANNTAIRFYKDNKLTFSVPTGCEITSISWEGNDFKTGVTTDVEACTSTTSALSWSGRAQSITFTRPSNANSYITLSSVTVKYEGKPADDVPVSSVSLNKTTASLVVGGTETLVATVNPDNATNKNVTWRSLNETVATVANGVVTGVSAGSATIRVTSVADPNKYAECTVTVTSGGGGYTTRKTVSYAGAAKKNSVWQVTTTGSAPTGSSVTYTQSYNTLYQMTGGNYVEYTITGFTGKKITKITLSMRSNSSSGSGYYYFKAGETTLSSVGTSSAAVAFNNASWYGNWSTSYVNVTPAMSDATHVVTSDENLKIYIKASLNSLYCNMITIEYYE